ncbi:MAG: hypothetical protein E7591_04810 [Ruminococcaceae bacterium]|nr:hypothetical protein [Oscillospiraceae bacterium]
MTKEIIVALLALLGTLSGSFMGVLTANKLVNYRIEQLEKKVDKHNNVIERTYKIEKRLSLVEELMERNENTIEELREYHKVV